MVAANLSLLLTMLFWGAQVPFIKALMTDWNVWQYSAVRYGLALAVLLPVALIATRQPLFGPGVTVLRVFLLGLGVASFVTLYTTGVALADPNSAAIASAMSPIVSALVAWVWTRVRPPAAIAVAGVLAIAGATLATLDWRGDQVSLDFHGGELLVLASHVCWASYSLMVQRWLPDRPQVHAAVLSALSSGILMTTVWLVLVLMEQLPLEPPPIDTPEEIFMLVWTSVGAISIGFIGWNYGVSKLGLPIAAFYPNLVPAFAMSTAAYMGIVPRMEQIAGAALVICGILYAQKSGIRALLATRPPAHAPREADVRT